MKMFFEIFEMPEEEEKKQKIKKVKMEIKDKTEALNLLLEHEPNFEGLRYKKRIHYCKHDEGKACTVEEI